MAEEEFPEETLEYRSLEKPMFREKIKPGYIQTSPSRSCLEMLLPILHEEGLDVPLSAASLLGQKDLEYD